MCILMMCTKFVNAISVSAMTTFQLSADKVQCHDFKVVLKRACPTNTTVPLAKHLQEVWPEKKFDQEIRNIQCTRPQLK